MPFDALFLTPELRAAVSDDTWVRAMVEAEGALAAAQERIGLVPAGTARAITAAGPFDAEELALDGRHAGNPVEPLVRRLRAAAGEHVHFGATSQDVLDTAAMLVARDALALVHGELRRAAAEAARLAEEHGSTVTVARTLLQQAVPTTFGLKAAGWLAGFCEAARGLDRVELPAQLGGAGGTLAALGDRGLEVLHLYATELGLAERALPWHARREPVARLAAALGLVASACDKVALDIELLAQTEVAEVGVAAPGPSSTMPHKRNPVPSVLARACAAGVHGAVSVLTGAVHEHERAAGAWHAEWKALSDALALAGGAAAWTAELLAGLEVDAERMRQNIRPETLSEAERFAPGAARPQDYVGSAGALIDRAQAFYREVFG